MTTKALSGAGARLARSLPKIGGARRSSTQLAFPPAGLSNFGGCVHPSKIRGGNTAPCESMLSLLGSTPVLSLNGLTSPLLGVDAPEIYVKLESTNPGWSVKARPAMHMLEQAERRGEIGPDTVIVESSSGDTAIAMAMVSAMKGYRFKPVVDIKMPQVALLPSPHLCMQRRPMHSQVLPVAEPHVRLPLDRLELPHAAPRRHMPPYAVRNRPAPVPPPHPAPPFPRPSSTCSASSARTSSSSATRRSRLSSRI